MSGKTETLSVKAEFVRTGWQGCVRVEYTITSLFRHLCQTQTHNRT